MTTTTQTETQTTTTEAPYLLLNGVAMWLEQEIARAERFQRYLRGEEV